MLKLPTWPLIKIWKRNEGFVRTLTGHQDCIVSLVLLKNGNLFSASKDKTIKIWNPQTGKCIRTIKSGKAKCLTLLKDGTIASVVDKKTIKVWNVDGTCIASMQGHREEIITLLELRDGSLASGSRDLTIRIWDKKGRCMHVYNATQQGNKSISPLQNMGGPKFLVELSDGTLASATTINYTVYEDYCIWLWNRKAISWSGMLKCHERCLNVFLLLQDNTLARAGWDGMIKIWDPITQTCLRTLKGHTDAIFSLIQLRDGNIASCSNDKTVKIWDVAGNCLCTLKHDNRVRNVSELRDGSLICETWNSTEVLIWAENKSVQESQTLKSSTRAKDLGSAVIEGQLDCRVEAVKQSYESAYVNADYTYPPRREEIEPGEQPTAPLWKDVQDIKE